MESEPRDGKILPNEPAAPSGIHASAGARRHEGPGTYHATPPIQPHNPQPVRRQTGKRWVLLITVAIFAIVLFQFRFRRHGTGPLDGYIADSSVLDREYSRFYGKAGSNPELEAKFKDAAAMTQRREYANAAALLETAARQASLPVLFNNLGVLYAEMNDRGRAVHAFYEGLARDGSYVPVRNNIERYKALIKDAADPLSREIEPNDTTPLANLIALDKPVEAEIAVNTRDIDTFRFNAPPPPRDILAVEFSNRSASLLPVVLLYDSDDRTIDLGAPETTPGSSFTRYFSVAPNTPLYLRLSGTRDTGGAYFLTIKPMKAYDSYEPNDDIFSARSVAIGTAVEANIMDAQDTDYYSFLATRTGTVTIDVRNRSTTLIPALSTFHPDRRSSGFGPDVRTPGADLHHRLDVQQGQIYFLQVWSQSSSSGDYTLSLN
jgi:hypothetical protein